MYLELTIFSFWYMSLFLVVCSRFVINVPGEERENVIRICFQMELAYWFYLDFYCTQDESMNKSCTREFFYQMFLVSKLGILLLIFVLLGWSIKKKKKIKVKLKKIELNFSSFLSCTQWLLDNQEKLVKDFVVLKFNVDENIFYFVLHLSTSHLWSTWPATLMQSCWTFAITRWRCRHLVPSSSARASRMFFWFRASFRKPPGGFRRAK